MSPILPKDEKDRTGERVGITRHIELRPTNLFYSVRNCYVYTQ